MKKFALILTAIAACGQNPSTKNTAPNASEATSASVLAAKAKPQILASASFVTDVKVSGDTLFWADNTGAISSVSINGGDSKVLATVAGMENDFPSLSVYEHSVFFAGGSFVGSVAKDGGTPNVLLSNQEAAGNVALRDYNLFWTSADFTSAQGGMINVMPMGGGTVTQVVTGLQSPSAAAIDANNFYWADLGAGTVSQIGLDGSQQIVLASEQSGLANVAVDAKNVYWTNFSGVLNKKPNLGDGTVNAAPIGGGDITVLAKGYSVTGMAVDGQSAFWFDMTQGTLNEVPVTGGKTVVLAQEASGSIIGPVLDACNIYWSTFDGSIKKVSKSRCN